MKNQERKSRISSLRLKGAPPFSAESCRNIMASTKREKYNKVVQYGDQGLPICHPVSRSSISQSYLYNLFVLKISSNHYSEKYFSFVQFPILLVTNY